MSKNAGWGVVEKPGEPGSGLAEITGIGERPPRPLHDYWSYALALAADTLGAEDGEGWREVKTGVFIKHGSPGWVDGFRVQLTGWG